MQPALELVPERAGGSSRGDAGRATIESMARVEPEQVRNPERIFIARSLRVSLRVEEWLTTAGVDYVVEVESIGRTLLFRTERMAAVFYVSAGQASYCREQLTAAGLGSGVVEAEEVHGSGSGF